jgi:hypothetical protein
MQDPGLIPGFFMLLVFAVLGSLMVYVVWSDRGTGGRLVILFLTALSLRFACSVLIYQFGLVSVIKDEDASGWVVGPALADRWRSKGVEPGALASAFLDPNLWRGQYHGYHYLVGILCYLTGASHRLEAVVLNCFAGAMAAVLAYRIADTLFSARAARLAGWLTCFWPSLVIWSAQTLKEPVVICLEAAVVYGCVRITVSGFSPRRFLLCSGAALLLAPFRFYAAYLAFLCIVLTLAVVPFARFSGKNTAAWAILLFVTLSLGLSIFLTQPTEYVDSFATVAQNYRAGVSYKQGSGFSTGYNLHSPAGFGMQVLVGGLHLLLAPFPWQMAGGSRRMLFTAPDVIAWWVVLIQGVLPGLRYTIRHRLIESFPLLVSIAGLGLFYSTIFGNIGLVYRQRAQVLLGLLILAAVGYSQRKGLVASGQPFGPPDHAIAYGQPGCRGN